MKLDIQRDIRDFRREAKYWASLASQMDMNSGRRAQRVRVQVGDGHTIDRGYVIEQLLLSIGRLLDRLDVVATHIDSNPKDISRLRTQFSHQLLRSAFPSANFRDKATIDGEFELDDGFVTEYLLASAGDLVTQILSGEERLAKTEYFVETALSDDFEKSVSHIQELRILGAWARLVPAAQVGVRLTNDHPALVRTLALASSLPLNVLKKFLSSEYIFPWSDIHRPFFGPMFEAAGIGNRSWLSYSGDQTIQSLGGEQKRVVQQLIYRFVDAIDFLGFDRWLEGMVDGYHMGENSLSGMRVPINVVPSRDSSNMCCWAVVAVARGSRGRGKTRLKSVVESLKNHLRKCPKTDVLVFVSDSWSPDAQEALQPEIKSIESRDGNAVLLLVTGNQITPIILRSER